MATGTCGCCKRRKNKVSRFPTAAAAAGSTSRSEMFPRGRWWTPLNIDAPRVSDEGRICGDTGCFGFLCANELQAELDYSIARFVSLGQQQKWGRENEQKEIEMMNNKKPPLEKILIQLPAAGCIFFSEFLWWFITNRLWLAAISLV